MSHSTVKGIVLCRPLYLQPRTINKILKIVRHSPLTAGKAEQTLWGVVTKIVGGLDGLQTISPVADAL